MNNFWFNDVSRYTENIEDNEYVPLKEEVNDTEFNYNKRTNSILGVNSLHENMKESNIIYYDSIYFTIYNYSNETLTIPNKLNGTIIRNVAGINLSNVKKIVIEEGIERIDSYAFLGCENLEEIVLPSTLKYIGNYAFLNCSHLKTITIPESVNYIGQGAFKGWEDDQKIMIPKVKESFDKNWSLGFNKEIIVEGKNEE